MISNIPTHYLQKVVILLVALALVQIAIGQSFEPNSIAEIDSNTNAINMILAFKHTVI